MYREALFILSIFLIIIGIVLGFIPVPAGDTIGNIAFWIGVILLVVWIILYAMSVIKSGN